MLQIDHLEQARHPSPGIYLATPGTTLARSGIPLIQLGSPSPGLHPSYIVHNIFIVREEGRKAQDSPLEPYQGNARACQGHPGGVWGDASGNRDGVKSGNIEGLTFNSDCGIMLWLEWRKPMTDPDYLTYRGRCKEFSEEAVRADPTLRLVRGHYYDPLWGKQAHWWTVRPDGSVYDPTAAQFPSKGSGHYEEFDGLVECEFCKKGVSEHDAYLVDPHVYCSYECYGHDVGF